MIVTLQIESIEAPLIESGEAASLVLALVARAQTMGFLPERQEQRIVVNRDFLREIAESLRQQGVATVAAGSLQRAIRTKRPNDVDLVAALRATLEAVDASPRPRAEWAPARDLLGDELLARLLRISVSSLRRYAAGERRTPDDVAWRLHLVARVLAALVGSYNDYGIRRWSSVGAARSAARRRPRSSNRQRARTTSGCRASSSSRRNSLAPLPPRDLVPDR